MQLACRRGYLIFVCPVCSFTCLRSATSHPVKNATISLAIFAPVQKALGAFSVSPARPSAHHRLQGKSAFA